MQWSDAEGAGFVGAGGTAEPWFPVNANYRDINVEAAESDPASLLAFYRKAVELRRRLDVVRDGTYREYKSHSTVLYSYARANAHQRLLVVCCFTDRTAYFSAPEGFDLRSGELVLSNYADAPLRGNAFFPRPWECRVYLWEG
jgi:glycosidase